jgi:hypothetical protein
MTYAWAKSAQGYESFITKYEYGEMLYKNPRGIGCIKCHREKGEGGYISSYKDKKGKNHILSAPRINHLSLEMFKDVLMRQKYRKKDKEGKLLKKNRVIFMPTYFLVEEEVESIHYYITQNLFQLEGNELKNELKKEK